MKTKLINLSIALLMPAVLSAGFGGLKVPGIDKGGEEEAAPSGLDASALQESLVRDYVLAANNINQAQEKLLAAFGKKDLVAQLQTLREKIANSDSPPSKQDLERLTELTKEATEAVEASVEAEEQLSDEGKELYREAIPYMVKGSVGIAKLSDTAGSFYDTAKDEIKSAGMMGATKVKSKLDAGLYVAPKIPGLIGSTAKTTKMLISYGKKIQVLDADAQYDEALKGADGPA